MRNKMRGIAKPREDGSHRVAGTPLSATSRSLPSMCNSRSKSFLALWILGVLNNSIFVVMNAGAKDIVSGGVALVYVSNVAPSLLAKGLAPFYFPHTSYSSRIHFCSILLAASLILVANFDSLNLKLIGIGVGALGGSIGEATFLAFTSRFGELSREAMTGWSSGTGFAGVFGYFWVAFFTKFLSTSFSVCLSAALVLPVAYLAVFLLVSREMEEWFKSDTDETEFEVEMAKTRSRSMGESGAEEQLVREQAKHVGAKSNAEDDEEVTLLGESEREERSALIKIDVNGPYGWLNRACIVFVLWRFTVPLFLVYFSEYAMQSGTWAAIGFPIEDKESRDKFYLNANWLYQVGVFLSRSSGLFCSVSLGQLWLMPILQFVLLCFFSLNGVMHLWWNQGLLLLAFIAGLFGGAVYVHGFMHIGRSVSPAQREIALGGTSLADTVGILLGNLAGLAIQGCLYGANHITDNGVPPVYECGFDYD